MDTVVEVAGRSGTLGALHKALARGPAGATADRVCEWLIVNGVVGLATGPRTSTRKKKLPGSL